MRNLLGSLRYNLRLLLESPGFTITTVLVRQIAWKRMRQIIWKVTFRNAVSFCVPTALILVADSFSAQALHDREFKLADQCSHLCLIFEERLCHGYAYVR